MNAMAETALPDQIHRYTPDEYESLEGHPSLDDRRVELIDGYIVDMSPRSPGHENAIGWLHRWLVRRLDDSKYELRLGQPLRISNSEPEPDFAVVDLDHPKHIHPTSAHFVIEVAWTSLNRDLEVKPAIYARAVSEYWVVDLHNLTVVVHRDPGPGGYRDIRVHQADEAITPVAFDLEPMPLAQLFAAA
jgi:Uma2 family endonuclease